MKECPFCSRCYDDVSRFCTQDGSKLCDSLPGSRILENRYQFDQFINRGHLKELYQATELETHNKVLVKVLSPLFFVSNEVEENFQKQIAQLLKLDTPYVEATYSFGKLTNGATYLITEFAEGESLRNLIGDEKRIPLLHSLEIGRQAAVGLGLAHQLGVLHLDLKPSNLLLTSDLNTQTLQVKIKNFGLACLKGSLGGALSTDTGSLVIRMPHYSSPEECSGQILNESSDIYSLGIILYELMAGIVPFESNLPMRIIAMHLSQEIPSLIKINPQIPNSIEKLISQMLAKSSHDRPNSMNIIAEELSKQIPINSLPILYKDVVKTINTPPINLEINSPSLNLPIRLTIIDSDDEGNKSRTISGNVHDAGIQGMRIQTGTIVTGALNIIKDHTVAFKNRLDIDVDLPTGTVHMEGFAVRYNRAPDGINWTVYIYIKEMTRLDRNKYEAFIKQT